MNSDIHEFIIHMVISSTIYIYIYIYIEFIWLFHVWIHMHINSHVWIHGFALISCMNSYNLWMYTWNWGCQDSRWPLTTHHLLGAGTISSMSTHFQLIWTGIFQSDKSHLSSDQKNGLFTLSGSDLGSEFTASFLRQSSSWTVSVNLSLCLT